MQVDEFPKLEKIIEKVPTAPVQPPSTALPSGVAERIEVMRQRPAPSVHDILLPQQGKQRVFSIRLVKAWGTLIIERIFLLKFPHFPCCQIQTRISLKTRQISTEFPTVNQKSKLAWFPTALSVSCKTHHTQFGH